MHPSFQHQKISTLFDRWASSDRAAQMAKGHQPLIDALLREIRAAAAGKSLLDLGCGTGAFLAQAQAFGFEPLCGIDASAKMVETAKAIAPSADIQIGTFEALPWPGKRFHHVTSIEALYYCPDPALVFEEVSRVLKTKGRFDGIIDYYAESLGTFSWPQGLGFEITRLSITQWEAFAQQAGLKVVSSRRIINPHAETLAAAWQPSVWYPTADSYADYLRNGAFWLTAIKR